MSAAFFFCLRILTRLTMGVAMLAPWAFAQAAPAVAVYYGREIPIAEFGPFDRVVVEPDHGHDPVGRRRQGTELYAYVSVGEVQPSRAYYGEMPASWKLGRDAHWGADVVDQRPADWPAFLASRVVEPLWQRGYRGFFLDTLDAYRLVPNADEAGQQAGLVRVIDTLHRRFPGIRLILNRGFEILPRVRDQVEMVAAESLFQRWNAATSRYEAVGEADRAWLLAQLNTVRERDRLPVLVIDYVAPHDRALARETARRIQALGFVPWVSDGALSTLGVGSLEVVPRHVLVLYNGAEAASLNFTNAHRYLQMPLNHLGYVVDYADVRQSLPTAIQRDRYAGVVTWFSGYLPDGRQQAVQQWLLARVQEGMRIAMVDDFGWAPDAAWASALGLEMSAAADGAGPWRLRHQHAMMGFEMALPEPGRDFVPIGLGVVGAASVTPLVEVDDAQGRVRVAGALMPWGGFLMSPFWLGQAPGLEQPRWLVDPFAFLTQALQLPPIPVPDVTTENGRRLLMAHIDGDGFPSRAERAGAPWAGEVLRKEVLETYRIPHAFSVIEAEVAPDGLHPQDSPQLEELARRIFQLPHVELATHSYSHPFLWDATALHGAFLDDAKRDYRLPVPGYQFDLKREIVGSADYINRRLAPPGKTVRMMFWTGDTAPGADALAVADAAGLLNLNGDDTFISRQYPSLTAVRGLGIVKGGHLQVYAPVTNENIYTNLWQGPFYGFERVIETYEMTERPRRLKPVGIYYHSYSATKRASLQALHKVYRWALAQPLSPVYPSEYIRKVQDFHAYALAWDGQGWRVSGAGDLRTLRLPPSLGVPVLAGSSAVAGYRDGAEGTYIHLSGGRAAFQTQPASALSGAARPFLREANARLTDWQVSADGARTTFTLQGHVPLRFSLAGVAGCQSRADQRPLSSSRPASPARSDVRSFELPDAVAHIQILCPSR